MISPDTRRLLERMKARERRNAGDDLTVEDSRNLLAEVERLLTVEAERDTLREALTERTLESFDRWTLWQDEKARVFALEEALRECAAAWADYGYSVRIGDDIAIEDFVAAALSSPVAEEETLHLPGCSLPGDHAGPCDGTMAREEEGT